MLFTLASSAFSDGSPIPAKHTCDGADASPPLRWTGAPPTTKTFALICDDPDAPGGTWVHWVLFNIGAEQDHLPEGVAAFEMLRELGGARQGINDSKRVGYGGPCPPPGKLHRYYFKIYALDAALPLKGKVSKAEVEGAMQGHVLANAELMGSYQRHKH